MNHLPSETSNQNEWVDVPGIIIKNDTPIYFEQIKSRYKDLMKPCKGILLESIIVGTRGKTRFFLYKNDPKNGHVWGSTIPNKILKKGSQYKLITDGSEYLITIK